MTYLSQLCRRFSRFAVQALCLAMVSIALWGGVLMPAATAAVGSERAADVINDRAAAELDRMAGAGTSDQIQGKAKSDIGTVKRKVGQVSDQFSDQLEGATDELAGKIQRDVGRTKAAATDASDDLSDKADGIVDSIKHLFD